MEGASRANGSRLVYAMERQAMRSLNYVGNKVFSLLFTWVLGQRIRDTLCGTKALFRRDYETMEIQWALLARADPLATITARSSRRSPSAGMRC